MDKPIPGGTSLTVFAQALALANEFKTQCPKILLAGPNVTFSLDMEIIAKLTLLNKLQINPNDVAQYQLCSDITSHIETLKMHLKTIGDDHPEEYRALTQASYYLQLETLKQSMDSYQEAAFSHLHSARRLITALHELKKLDPKEHGAIHNLLTSLEKTFNENNLRADDKLTQMTQQIYDAHDAIKKNSRTPITFFGAKPKTNPLTPAFELFMRENMAAPSKEERPSSPRPGNTSTG